MTAPDDDVEYEQCRFCHGYGKTMCFDGCCEYDCEECSGVGVLAR